MSALSPSADPVVDAVIRQFRDLAARTYAQGADGGPDPAAFDTVVTCVVSLAQSKCAQVLSTLIAWREGLKLGNDNRKRLALEILFADVANKVLTAAGLASSTPGKLRSALEEYCFDITLKADRLCPAGDPVANAEVKAALIDAASRLLGTLSRFGRGDDGQPAGLQSIVQLYLREFDARSPRPDAGLNRAELSSLIGLMHRVHLDLTSDSGARLATAFVTEASPLRRCPPKKKSEIQHAVCAMLADVVFAVTMTQGKAPPPDASQLADAGRAWFDAVASLRSQLQTWSDKKSKHTCAGYPLVTALTCAGDPRTLDANVASLTESLLRLLRDKGTRSMALDCLRRLLRSYLDLTRYSVRSREAAKDALASTLHVICSTLVTLMRKNVLGGDTCLPSLVDVFAIIAARQPSFAARVILQELLKLPAASGAAAAGPGTLSEITLVGVQALHALITQGGGEAARGHGATPGLDGGEGAAGEPASAPLSSSSSLPAVPLEKVKSIAPFVPQLSAALGSIIKCCHALFGQALLTSAKAGSDAAAKDKSAERATSLAVFRWAIRCVPAVMPEQWGHLKICQVLPVYSINQDAGVRKEVASLFHRVVTSLPAARGPAVTSLALFLLRIPDEFPQIVHVSLSQLVSLLKAWMDCLTLHGAERGPVDPGAKAPPVASLPSHDIGEMDASFLQAVGLVFLCSADARIRTAALELLRWVRALAHVVAEARRPGLSALVRGGSMGASGFGDTPRLFLADILEESGSLVTEPCAFDTSRWTPLGWRRKALAPGTTLASLCASADPKDAMLWSLCLASLAKVAGRLVPDCLQTARGEVGSRLLQLSYVDGGGSHLHTDHALEQWHNYCVFAAASCAPLPAATVGAGRGAGAGHPHQHHRSELPSDAPVGMAGVAPLSPTLSEHGGAHPLASLDPSRAGSGGAGTTAGVTSGSSGASSAAGRGSDAAKSGGRPLTAKEVIKLVLPYLRSLNDAHQLSAVVVLGHCHADMLRVLVQELLAVWEEVTAGGAPEKATKWKAGTSKGGAGGRREESRVSVAIAHIFRFATASITAIAAPSGPGSAGEGSGADGSSLQAAVRDGLVRFVTDAATSIGLQKTVGSSGPVGTLGSASGSSSNADALASPLSTGMVVGDLNALRFCLAAIVRMCAGLGAAKGAPTLAFAASSPATSASSGAVTLSPTSGTPWFPPALRRRLFFLFGSIVEGAGGSSGVSFNSGGSASHLLYLQLHHQHSTALQRVKDPAERAASEAELAEQADAVHTASLEAMAALLEGPAWDPDEVARLAGPVVTWVDRHLAVSLPTGVMAGHAPTFGTHAAAGLASMSLASAPSLPAGFSLASGADAVANASNAAAPAATPTTSLISGSGASAPHHRPAQRTPSALSMASGTASIPAGTLRGQASNTSALHAATAGVAPEYPDADGHYPQGYCGYGGGALGGGGEHQGELPWADACIISRVASGVGAAGLANLLACNPRLFQPFVDQAYLPDASKANAYFVVMAGLYLRYEIPCDLPVMLALALYKLVDEDKGVRQLALQLMEMIKARHWIGAAGSSSNSNATSSAAFFKGEAGAAASSMGVGSASSANAEIFGHYQFAVVGGVPGVYGNFQCQLSAQLARQLAPLSAPMVEEMLSRQLAVYRGCLRAGQAGSYSGGGAGDSIMALDSPAATPAAVEYGSHSRKDSTSSLSSFISHVGQGPGTERTDGSGGARALVGDVAGAMLQRALRAQPYLLACCNQWIDSVSFHATAAGVGWGGASPGGRGGTAYGVLRMLCAVTHELGHLPGAERDIEAMWRTLGSSVKNVIPVLDAILTGMVAAQQPRPQPQAQAQGKPPGMGGTGGAHAGAPWLLPAEWMCADVSRRDDGGGAGASSSSAGASSSCGLEQQVHVLKKAVLYMARSSPQQVIDHLVFELSRMVDEGELGGETAGAGASTAGGAAKGSGAATPMPSMAASGVFGADLGDGGEPSAAAGTSAIGVGGGDRLVMLDEAHLAILGKCLDGLDGGHPAHTDKDLGRVRLSLAGGAMVAAALGMEEPQQTGGGAPKPATSAGRAEATTSVRSPAVASSSSTAPGDGVGSPSSPRNSLRLSRAEICLMLLAEVAAEHDDELRDHLPLLAHASVSLMDHGVPLLFSAAKQLLLSLLYAFGIRHAGLLGGTAAAMATGGVMGADASNATGAVGAGGVPHAGPLAALLMAGTASGDSLLSSFGRASNARGRSSQGGAGGAMFRDGTVGDGDPPVVRALRHLSTWWGPTLWPREVIHVARTDLQSVEQLSALVAAVLASVPSGTELLERWAEVALSWAVGARSAHLAGRSHQIFRSLGAPSRPDKCLSLLRCLHATLAGAPQDVLLGTTLEVVLSLRAVVAGMGADKAVLVPQVFWAAVVLLHTTFVHLYTHALSLLSVVMDRLKLSDATVQLVLLSTMPRDLLKEDASRGGASSSASKPRPFTSVNVPAATPAAPPLPPSSLSTSALPSMAAVRAGTSQPQGSASQVPPAYPTEGGGSAGGGGGGAGSQFDGVHSLVMKGMASRASVRVAAEVLVKLLTAPCDQIMGPSDTRLAMSLLALLPWMVTHRPPMRWLPPSRLHPQGSGGGEGNGAAPLDKSADVFDGRQHQPWLTANMMLTIAAGEAIAQACAGRRLGELGAAFLALATRDYASDGAFLGAVIGPFAAAFLPRYGTASYVHLLRMLEHGPSDHRRAVLLILTALLATSPPPSAVISSRLFAVASGHLVGPLAREATALLQAGTQARAGNASA